MPGAAAIAIFLLLQAAFRSWRLAVLAFLTLPVALVGGVLAALIDGAELSLGSMLAFLALFGLAARHSVVLVRHLQDLELQESEALRLPLVERGARERLGPVLTSVSATALVMLPFVIAGDIPGLEIVHPMAVVILGGLVSTTLLALFVLPTLYLRFGAGARPSVSPEEEIMHRLAGIEPVPAGPAAEAARAPAGEGEGIRERPAGGLAWRVRPLFAGVMLAVAGLSLSACSEMETETAAGYEPATLESVKGRDDFKRVTLTAEGARRIGLKTAKVGRTGGAEGRPIRRVDLRRGGGYLRLHELAAAVLPAGGGRGPTRRWKPGAALGGSARRHHGGDGRSGRGLRRGARDRQQMTGRAGRR